MSSSIALALTAELEPAPERKRQSKKGSRAGLTTEPKLKRGPPRPHRRLPDDVLTMRVDRLRKRLERARKQHEDARRLMTKYLHETTYRLRDTLNNDPPAAPTAPLETIDPLPSDPQ